MLRAPTPSSMKKHLQHRVLVSSDTPRSTAPPPVLPSLPDGFVPPIPSIALPPFPTPIIVSQNKRPRLEGPDYECAKVSVAPVTKPPALNMRNKHSCQSEEYVGGARRRRALAKKHDAPSPTVDNQTYYQRPTTSQPVYPQVPPILPLSTPQIVS